MAPSATPSFFAPPSPAPWSCLPLPVEPLAPCLRWTRLVSLVFLLFCVPLLSPVSRSWLFFCCLPYLSWVLLLHSFSDECCPASVVARFVVPRCLPCRVLFPLPRPGVSARVCAAFSTCGPCDSLPWRWRAPRSRCSSCRVLFPLRLPGVSPAFASPSPCPGFAIPCPWPCRARRSLPRRQCHVLPRCRSSLRWPRVTLRQTSWRVTLFRP